MKYRRLSLVIVGILAIGISTLGMMGCAATSQEDSFNMIQQTDQIELEYAVPEYEYDTEASVSLLPWIALGELESHPELREAVDKQLGTVLDAEGGKVGMLYFDTEALVNTNNSTLFMALKNSAFTLQVLGNEDALAELGAIAAENYTDVEADDLSSAYATINAYFELLPDAEAGVFDGTASISRAQAMALVMRATTPVNEAQAPEVDAEFTTAVGSTEYTDFAAPMDAYAYINTSNGLNEKTFDGTMTRGEYISLLMNLIFKDYEGEIPETELAVLKDAGNITLAEAISDASKGAPSDMYTTLKNAVALGIVDEDSLEWDSVLTKADAIQLFIEANAVHNGLVGYFTLPSEAYKPGYTVNEDGSYSYDGSKDTSDSYDKEIWEGEQWLKDEAYKLAGCESMKEFVDTYAPGQGYKSR